MQTIEQQIRLISGLRLGFGIAALVFLTLAVFLFFWFKIPQVFNEYRGKNAKKEMEEMAAKNQDTGSLLTGSGKKKKGSVKRHYSDHLTDELAKETGQTSEMEVSENYLQPDTVPVSVTNPIDAMSESEATDVLTSQLNEEEMQTTVMNQPVSQETEVLSASELQDVVPSQQDGTMVLDASFLKKQEQNFVVERTVLLVHTEMVIE